MADDNKHQKGDEIDLTPEDEMILDAVWDELNREWGKHAEVTKKEKPTNGR